MISRQYIIEVKLKSSEVESFDEYPFNLNVVKHLDSLELHPSVTFLIGENGNIGKFIYQVQIHDRYFINFAIDYAYFLKRREESEKALAILMEPLLLTDMDKNPNIFPQRKGVLIQEGAIVPDDVRMGSIKLHRDKSFRYGGISADSRRS